MIRVWWHRLRRHHVRDLGYPLGRRRVWCYDCAEDLLPWDEATVAPLDLLYEERP